MSAPALDAVGLTKRYGRVPALTDVSVSIPRGAITALIGPNGAGKSTIIKVWLGFERPTRGTTSVAGQDPVGDTAAVLRKVGYLAQGAPLYQDLTVRDHLALAQSLRKSFDISYASGRIERLRIPAATPTGRLSGGQQAQVALAIVLATHPSVLLLDEPLASLDPLARREFLNELVETAHREGQTVLLSSHIVSDIEHACDTLVVIGDGRLLLAAPVADAINRHVVGPQQQSGGRPIGLLRTGPRDAPRALYDAGSVPPSNELSAPSLEELVLGYLAGGRDDVWSTP